MRDADRAAPPAMTETGAHFAGKRGRGWQLAASVVVPLMMAGAYAVLISTSEVGTSGALWESGGFVLVLGFWFAFRIMTRRAALSRAIAVGDPDRILELATRPSQAIERAIAYELRRDWPDVLRALEEARPATAEAHVIAAAVRIHALCETGEVARARELLDREIEPRVAGLDRRMQATGHGRAQLARARVLAAEGQRAEAEAVLARVVDDVRADPTTRAAAQQLRTGHSS